MAKVTANSKEVRGLYSEACHGAGAEPRKIARQQLEAMADRHGQRLGQFFAEYGLDLSCYFASRPT